MSAADRWFEDIRAKLVRLRDFDGTDTHVTEVRMIFVHCKINNIFEARNNPEMLATIEGAVDHQLKYLKHKNEIRNTRPH